jgi:two-component system catabolic regulation response regulator CreB
VHEAIQGALPRVLVVEDDAGIADAVAYALERDGMAPVVAGTLAAAREHAAGVDLAVLDLGLPDGSGFALLHEWRAGGAGPAVIVLTSRDAEVDCVASLEAGADDFVSKPFSPRALVARVRAVLRRGVRAQVFVAPAREPHSGLSLDLERRTAAYAGRAIDLTKTELDLLAVLVAARGRVLTREHLVERVWGHGHALTERTVDTHVKAVRRKLGEAGAPPSFIEAVRGVGFKIEVAP